MSDSLSVLVTGATGQQGGALARVLLDKGHRVRAFVRRPDAPKAKELERLGAELADLPPRRLVLGSSYPGSSTAPVKHLNYSLL